MNFHFFDGWRSAVVSNFFDIIFKVERCFYITAGENCREKFPGIFG